VTSHTTRLYALALALLVFFITWAAIAARPWATATAHRDPRVAMLAAREQRIRHESLVVKRIVEGRWARYRVELRQRQSQIASAHRAQLASAAAPPTVRVVNLPPLTITRTS
jgi:hypothetical protein